MAKNEIADRYKSILLPNHTIYEVKIYVRWDFPVMVINILSVWDFSHCYLHHCLQNLTNGRHWSWGHYNRQKWWQTVGCETILLEIVRGTMAVSSYTLKPNTIKSHPNLQIRKGNIMEIPYQKLRDKISMGKIQPLKETLT